MMEVKGTGVLQANPSTVSGGAAVIDLAKEANKEEFSGFNPAKGKEKQRWYMLFIIGGLFVALNAAVISLIFHAIGIDVGFITAHPELAHERIITSAVFQALIGATVVQTGAVTWAMARFLFPNQPD
jgi:hypothetical protein